MNIKRHAFPVILLVSLVAGCASMRAIPLDQSFWQEKAKRVGVVLTLPPPAEVHLVSSLAPMVRGGYPMMIVGGMRDTEYIDVPLLMAESRSLREASQGLDAREFAVVQTLFVQGLKDKGFFAFALEQRIDEGSLQPFRDGPGDAVYACRDYRELGRAAGVDYLIVAGLKRYGTTCRYVGMDDYAVEVYAGVRAQMIEVATNRVLWRTGAFDTSFNRTVNASCWRPDHTHVILDALKALLKEAATETAGRFFSPEP